MTFKASTRQKEFEEKGWITLWFRQHEQLYPWFRKGVLHNKQKQWFCWHQATTWPENLWTSMTWIESCFAFRCTKANGCVLLQSVNERKVESNPVARDAPAAVKSSEGNRAHSTSIFMSYLHLHDLHTSLSESCIPFQTNRFALSHRNAMCELQPPQTPPVQTWTALTFIRLPQSICPELCNWHTHCMCQVCVMKEVAALWDTLMHHWYLPALLTDEDQVSSIGLKVNNRRNKFLSLVNL